MEQEPWWKRQEREAREHNQTSKEERKAKKQRKEEEKQQKQRIKEEQDKRPESIKNFEYAYLFSLFIGLQMYIRHPEMRPEIKMSISFEIGILFFMYGSLTLLCLLASRKRSNISKWIVVIVSGFSIFSTILYIPEIVSGLVSLSLLEISQTVQLFCVCTAIKCAFAKESRDWFAGIQIKNDEVEVS